MLWRKEFGKSLYRLANTFATVLILGALANVAFRKVDFKEIWWLLLLGIVSTIILYSVGTRRLKRAQAEFEASEQLKRLFYD